MANVFVRRAATWIFSFSVLVALLAAYVFLVFWDNTIDLGASWVAKLDLWYWVVFFTVALSLALVLLLILFIMHKHEPASATTGAASDTPLADEWGETAPLTTTEPAQAPPQVVETVEPEPVDAQADALLVRCMNCRHEFEIPFQEARPVYATCPQCGEEAVLDEGEEVLHTGGDPVVEIEGIGKVFSEKLNRAGVYTTEQLRSVDAARLASQTEIAQTSIEFWQAQADLFRVKGVGKQHAELLALSGIKSVAQLSATEPKELAAMIKTYLASVDNPPTKATVDVRRARTLVQEAKNVVDGT